MSNVINGIVWVDREGQFVVLNETMTHTKTKVTWTFTENIHEATNTNRLPRDLRQRKDLSPVPVLIERSVSIKQFGEKS